MRYSVLAVVALLSSCSEKEKKVDFYVTCPNCDVVYGIDGKDVIEEGERVERNGFRATLTGNKGDGAQLSIHNVDIAGAVRLRIVADGETIVDETSNTDEDGSSAAFVRGFIP